MDFENRYAGVLIKRYKRFFADIKLKTKLLLRTVRPNPGSMFKLLDKGNPVLDNKI